MTGTFKLPLDLILAKNTFNMFQFIEGRWYQTDIPSHDVRLTLDTSFNVFDKDALNHRNSVTGGTAFNTINTFLWEIADDGVGTRREKQPCKLLVAEDKFTKVSLTCVSDEYFCVTESLLSKSISSVSIPRDSIKFLLGGNIISKG